MRIIHSYIYILACAAIIAPQAGAQDAATQQQIDKLSGQIQDIEDAQTAQNKRIDALEKEIGDLRDKLNQPDAGSFASADDLKKLADQVQEMDKKRQQDNEGIVNALEKLAKTAGQAAPSHKPAGVSQTTTPENPAPEGGGAQKGYEYPVAAGDTLSAIAKAYRTQGIKVTVNKILKANPGLNPNNLKVGQKIWIPQGEEK